MEPNLPAFGDRSTGVAYVFRAGGYVVLFNRQGEVAVVVTPKGVMLPGGGQEEGETPEQAAIREVEEECGLRIVLRGRIGVADELVFAAEEQTHYQKRCTFFVAEVVGEGNPGECDHQLIWLFPTSAIQQLTHASQRWSVVRAFEMFRGGD